jgi:hypothetical protein
MFCENQETNVSRNMLVILHETPNDVGELFHRHNSSASVPGLIPGVNGRSLVERVQIEKKRNSQ